MPPTDNPDGEPVEQRIVDVMTRLSRVTARRFDDSGLDASAYWTLLALRQAGPMRMTELAAKVGLDPSTVSRKLHLLTERGYIARTPDPDDGRACQLGLSDEGCALLAQARDSRLRVLTERLSAWDPSEVATFERLLTRLADDVTEFQEQT